MINADMKAYDYFLFGDYNGYGQQQLSEEVQGSIKMAINTTSQTIQSNILYKDATYVGLTHSKDIDDTYVIQYGELKLKVLNVNTKGRLTQVFLTNYD